MSQLIRLFWYLVPIVRSAAFQVAADMLTDIAYPNGPRPRVRVQVKQKGSGRKATVDLDEMARKREVVNRSYTERMVPSQRRTINLDARAAREAEAARNGYHDVIMVAFDLRGPSAKKVHEWLHEQMPYGDASYGPNEEIHLDSWWVANDLRFDRSDCDSAVFVTPGKQAEARELLRKHGLVS